MNIVLIGYRGTGKSVISKVLADTLHCPRYSLDDEVAKKAGQSISEIVKQQGWKKFREIEREVVERVSLVTQSSIIDCGGGVVLDDRNMTDLRRNGKIALLTSSFEQIIHRVSRDMSRPPLEVTLSFEEEQRKVLIERDPKYRAAADCVFDTSHLKPRQVAIKIIEHFKKKDWI
jgi:shikimate kinase